MQSVDLRRATTDDARPRNFVVLHDDELVEATGLRSLYRVVSPNSPLLGVTDPADIEYPDLFDEVDQSVFTDYGRSRMVVVSREVESHAYRHGGTLHAGSQTFSKLKPQYRLYERLADAGVETHVYGAPDWDVPTDAHTDHASDDEEITATWCVVLDHENAEHKRALLAEERSQNQFYGFWTFETDIVDVILRRLGGFPSTAESATWSSTDESATPSFSPTYSSTAVIESRQSSGTLRGSPVPGSSATCVVSPSTATPSSSRISYAIVKLVFPTSVTETATSTSRANWTGRRKSTSRLATTMLSSPSGTPSASIR